MKQTRILWSNELQNAIIKSDIPGWFRSTTTTKKPGSSFIMFSASVFLLLLLFSATERIVRITRCSHRCRHLLLRVVYAFCITLFAFWANKFINIFYTFQNSKKKKKKKKECKHQCRSFCHVHFTIFRLSNFQFVSFYYFRRIFSLFDFILFFCFVTNCFIGFFGVCIHLFVFDFFNREATFISWGH